MLLDRPAQEEGVLAPQLRGGPPSPDRPEPDGRNRRALREELGVDWQAGHRQIDQRGVEALAPLGRVSEQQLDLRTAGGAPDRTPR